MLSICGRDITNISVLRRWLSESRTCVPFLNHCCEMESVIQACGFWIMEFVVDFYCYSIRHSILDYSSALKLRHPQMKTTRLFGSALWMRLVCLSLRTLRSSDITQTGGGRELSGEPPRQRCTIF